MGLSPLGGWFNMKLDTLVVGLDNVYKSVDDLLFHAGSISELEELLRKYFLNCRNEDAQLSEKSLSLVHNLFFVKH